MFIGYYLNKNKLIHHLQTNFLCANFYASVSHIQTNLQQKTEYMLFCYRTLYSILSSTDVIQYQLTTN